MRIGIDLGGTKIEAIALDAAGATLARRRIDTPRDDYPATLRAIAALVAALETETGSRGTVGVGTPGALSPFTGRMRNANSTWLNDRALDRDLASALGRPVRLANDADCFALSEATDGAARVPAASSGSSSAPGPEPAWSSTGACWPAPMPSPGSGATTPCPGRAPRAPRPRLLPAVNTAASRPSCQARAWRRITPAPPATTGAPRNRRSGAGRRGPANAALARHADRLARGLASVINVLDPDVIVLGGGLSNLAHLYTTVPKLLGRYLFSDGVATRLVPPRHGDSSGVRGAAWLWPIQP